MVAGLRLNNSTAWAAFDQMEEKVVALEAQAESVGILATPDSVESRFAALEGTGGLDDELAALKRGLLPEPRPAAVAAGTGGAAAPARPLFSDAVVARAGEALEIDAELDALRKRARA